MKKPLSGPCARIYDMRNYIKSGVLMALILLGVRVLRDGWDVKWMGWADLFIGSLLLVLLALAFAVIGGLIGALVGWDHQRQERRAMLKRQAAQIPPESISYHSGQVSSAPAALPSHQAK